MEKFSLTDTTKWKKITGDIYVAGVPCVGYISPRLPEVQPAGSLHSKTQHLEVEVAE